MPDKYERMAQLRQILRHMFDIGQEFYQELQRLLEHNTALKAAGAKLEGQVEELKSELNDARSAMDKKLAAEKASFEQRLAEKDKLIDDLNAKNIMLERAYTNILKDLKDEQFFHANIDAMKLLDREKRNYELESEKLTERKNDLDTRENDLSKAYEALKKDWEHLKKQQEDCDKQARRNKEERLELEATSLRRRVERDRAGESGAQTPGHEGTRLHASSAASEEAWNFPPPGRTERKEPADLLKQWQTENTKPKNAEPDAKSVTGQNYGTGTARPAKANSPFSRPLGNGGGDGLDGDAGKIKDIFADKDPM